MIVNQWIPEECAVLLQADPRDPKVLLQWPPPGFRTVGPPEKVKPAPSTVVVGKPPELYS